MTRVSHATILVWFRQDLRLADHPALVWAAEQGGRVLPVYVLAPEEEGRWAPGRVSRAVLRECLAALDADLRARGARLWIRRGPAARALLDLAHECGATTVCWNRRYEPDAACQAENVERTLRAAGIDTCSFPGGLLVEPQDMRTRAGGPFKVFTPFYRALLDRYLHEPPLRAPLRVPAPEPPPRSLALTGCGSVLELDGPDDVSSRWRFEERAVRAQLAEFMRTRCPGYAADRDRLDLDGTSRLGLALHFGLLSPRQIWDAAAAAGRATRDPRVRAGIDAFLRQLVWREFAHHLLAHFPRTPEKPLRAEFTAFRWRRDVRGLHAWQAGRTGYPVVDAAMRQLRQTGWMHNRARLIAASFLVKDLLLPWQQGAAWFWDTLVDADLANNTLGWQWTAGCGADAAPFFRIFNPVLQGRKFDPHGEYVRRCVPELSALPDRHIHAPWEAPREVLQRAGVALGRTYPHPIVDHGEARERALEAFAALGPA
jgi:deoxyribodipyrimidine photo-lyase